MVHRRCLHYLIPVLLVGIGLGVCMLVIVRVYECHHVCQVVEEVETASDRMERDDPDQKKTLYGVQQT
jgi:hypothetical protein